MFYQYPGIHPTFPYTVPTLPTEYATAYSYEEQLLCLIQQVDKIKKAIEDFDLPGIQNALAEMRTEISNWEANFQAQLNNFINQYTTDIQNTLSQIETIAEAMNSGNKAYTDAKFNELKILIEQLEKSYVILNPYKGCYTTLDEWANDVAQLTAFYGITANQYANLELTADEYKALNLSAYRYGYEFKRYYWYKIKRIINPFSGERTTTQQMINELATFHQNGYTAQTYADFDIDATTYEGYDISAATYANTAWHTA